MLREILEVHWPKCIYFSIIRKPSILKMPILSKLIYKINVTPIPIPVPEGFLFENWLAESKNVYEENKEPRIAKKNVNCRSNVLEEIHYQIAGLILQLV